jgi:hypothetical protein
LKKYVDVNHSEILRKFEEEVNYVMKTSMESQPVTKKPNASYSSISHFFTSKEPFKKDDVEQ